jgi:hypothetical protein
LALQHKSILRRRLEKLKRSLVVPKRFTTSPESSRIPLTVPILPSTLLALPQVKSKSLKKQPTFKRLAPLVQLVNSWELAAEGGLESVVPAYGYGQQAQQSGLYGQGIGFSYGQMATDPRAVQAYMSPYQQGVTDIAKAQAIEDAKKSQLGANLGAVRQGTYGGARQSLVQAQREAALQKQLSDIQTQGLQSAYDQAVKAQQFGVTSGIQGAQAGIQGAQAGLQGVGGSTGWLWYGWSNWSRINWVGPGSTGRRYRSTWVSRPDG